MKAGYNKPINKNLLQAHQMLTELPHLYHCWDADELREMDLPEQPKTCLGGVTPFLRTLQWAPVDSP